MFIISLFLFTDIDCILTESYFETIINNKFNDSYSLVTGPVEVSIHLNNIYEYFDKAAYLNQSNYHNHRHRFITIIIRRGPWPQSV